MDVLGKLSFLDLPDVNTDPVLIADGGGIVSFAGGTSAARPAAGIIGRVYLDTDTNRLFYDDGSVWIDTTQVPLIDGTADQIDVVDGTNVTPAIVSLASNPIIPGTARLRLPVGTTAQRPVAPTAGDTRFNSTANVKETFNGSHWVPEGAVLQVVSGSIAATTTTAQIPFDNSTPTIAEGAQIWTQSFTPISATSRILIQYSLVVAQSTAARIITTATFAGATNIGSSSHNIATGATTQNLPQSMSLQTVHVPGSIAPITFSARIGANGTGTTYVNTTTGGTLGGTLVSFYTITELA